MWFALSIAFAGVVVDPVPPQLLVAPAPGRDVIEAAAPSYCMGAFGTVSTSLATEKTLSTLFGLGEIQGGASIDLQDRMWMDASAVARMACAWPDDVHARRWVATFKQLAVNRLGVSGDFMERFLAANIMETQGRLRTRIQANRSTCGVVSPSVVDEGLASRNRALRAFVCEGRVDASVGVEWWLDAAEPTAVHRALLIERFLVTPERVAAGDSLVPSLFIHKDIAAFDATAVAADIRAQVDEPYSLMGELHAAALDRRIKATASAWTERQKAVPELKAVFEASDHAHSAWTKNYQRHRDGFEAIQRMESQWLEQYNDPTDGCEERLWPLVNAWASSVGATSPSRFEDALESSYAWNLIAATSRCEKGMGNDGRSDILRYVLGRAPARRGPRTDAVLAGVAHAAALKAEDFPYIVKGVEAFSVTGTGAFAAPRDWLAAPTVLAQPNTVHGHVQTVAEDGDGFRVVLAPVDGAKEPSVFAVDKRFAKGLKPGVFAELQSIGDGFFVYAIRSDPQAETATNPYGW